MLIVPAIDLRQGRCVRLLQGRRADVTVYGDDPIGIAQGFEREGAEMLHVVDLDGAFDDSGSPNRSVIQRIVGEVRIPVQVGGGLRTLDAIQRAIDDGASRVVVGTLAVRSPEVLDTLVRRFGDRLAVGIDARDGRVLTHGWETASDLQATELARRVARAGVKRIVYTDVARDGMLSGVNVEQTRAVAVASGIAVTASGGVASLADIERLLGESPCGIDSAIVGKALYEGRFTLAEAMRTVRDRIGDETPGTVPRAGATGSSRIDGTASGSDRLVPDRRNRER